MSKRARFEDPWDDEAVTEAWDGMPKNQYDEGRDRMGKCLHDYLIQLKIMGKLTATHVTTIAYFHQSSGGRGCSRLALPAKKEHNRVNLDLTNASRIVKEELRREHTPPVLHPVPTPIFNKTICRRELTDIPVSQISLAALLLLFVAIVMRYLCYRYAVVYITSIGFVADDRYKKYREWFGCGNVSFWGGRSCDCKWGSRCRLVFASSSAPDKLQEVTLCSHTASFSFL